MSFNQPAPPNPYQVAGAQEQVNQQSAINQAAINNVNQVTPYGTETYNITGTNAQGIPQYTATTQLNPQSQGLLNTYMNTQQGIGTAANRLISNLGPSLSSAPNLDPSALTGQMMRWFQQYEQPIWNQQQSNLNSGLANQGITPGSEAYNNAQNLQARNVGNASNQFFTMAEPQAFSQALATYQAPIQTLGTLLGESQPGSVTQNLAPTQTESIGAPNISGDIYQSYAGNLSNYQNTMAGLFGLGSAALGGIARQSDRRIKENITKVGKLDNGLPIYIFNFKMDPDGIPQIGLMAQDVEQIYPDAVHTINGIKHVDYAKAVKNGPYSL